MAAPVQIMGDGVAAQGESDHDGVLAGGAMRGHASAVEGAVEGVVERFGVFAPAVAAVVDAVAAVGFGVLAQVFGAVVAAFVVVFGVVDAVGLHGAAGGGEVDVPAVDVALVAARVDFGHGQWLVGRFAGVDDATFVQAAVEGPDVVCVAARAFDLRERGGFSGAGVWWDQDG